MLFRFITALLLLFCVTKNFAQDVISRRPLKSPEDIRAGLFEIPESDSAIFIRVDLPEEEYLMLRMKNISAWMAGSLPDIIAVASQLYDQLADSFKDATSSRRLAIRIPEKGSILTQLSESGGGKRTMLMTGKEAQAIRIATDTLTVLQQTSGEVDKAVLYTFLLKDLDRIQTLSGNAALVQKISGTVDSLIQNRLQKWKKPNAPRHFLAARYDLTEGAGTNGTLTLGDRSSVGNSFHYSSSLGISFLAGNVATYADYKFSYQWPNQKRAITKYAALSYSINIFYGREGAAVKGTVLHFLNAEFGSSFGQSERGPLYNTSVGIGYRIAGNNTAPYDYRYRLFLNYSLSPAITITPDYYFSGRKYDSNQAADPSYSAGGLTLTIRLF